MTSKHWTLVGGAVACLTGAIFSPSLYAAPWVSTGSIQERHAFQAQADEGELNRTVTTWPMMRPAEQRRNGREGQIRIAGTTDPFFLRGFEAQPRESVESSASMEWQSDHLAAKLEVGYAADPEDDESLRGDGSYIAGLAANWVVGAGYIDRWWGPGWQSSLILSNNARPVPALWINRDNPKAFDTPWLSWIGPWQFTAFLGQLEEERHVPDAYLAGARVTFRPVQGLDIGLSRTFIIGGEGRSASSETFWDAIIGNDNPRDAAEDPSNQLGAVDVRYGFPVGGQTAGIYAQMMGEDEAGGFPARKSWLVGTDWTTRIAGMDQQWFLEGADTLADNLLGDPMPDVSYEHRVYRSGYRYKGRNLATSIEADAQAVTLGVFNFTETGQQLGLSLSWLDLAGKDESRVSNPDPNVQYSVPRWNRELVTLSASYSQPLPIGTLSLQAMLADEKIELIGGKERDQWSASASWRYAF
ncbi:capsule assembly Wzi family protein [Marinobacter sp. ATCH36]|uniref:capsule assembly Wzi family protein n=1 Tax=Marinobacter sp. ATCH36 TaxID=2945106 RepID=UPI00202156D7|nr:capsule assembly Wzi family protein [Marinobacter sp. ATCH36]MCL7945155.1 capsule assembly Wzi family protein [Marinobacter sp. ATCH36]